MNAIAPGFIATDMTDVLDENIKAEMLKVIPAAQFGEAQDIANAVTFCFDQSKYVTGQTLNVDGGMVM